MDICYADLSKEAGRLQHCVGLILERLAKFKRATLAYAILAVIVSSIAAYSPTLTNNQGDLVTHC